MRQSMRRAGTALAASVALLAAGCGSSGDDDGDGGAADDQANEQQDTDGEDAGDDGEVDGSLPGVWGSSGGAQSMLHVGQDDVATLVLESEVCLGVVASQSGQDVVSLHCQDSSEYGTGHATVSGETLSVRWEGGGDGEYERIADLDVDLSELQLDEYGLTELENFDPNEIDLDAVDLDEMQRDLEGSLNLDDIDQDILDEVFE